MSLDLYCVRCHKTTLHNFGRELNKSVRRPKCAMVCDVCRYEGYALARRTAEAVAKDAAA